MTDCNGDGDCLMGLQRGGGRYDISNCIHNCMPVKCPNFLVCGSIAPQTIYNINYGRCLNCRVSFNVNLEFARYEKCSSCEHTGIVVKQPTCSHKVCAKCFQNMHFKNKEFACNSCN